MTKLVIEKFHFSTPKTEGIRPVTSSIKFLVFFSAAHIILYSTSIGSCSSRGNGFIIRSSRFLIFFIGFVSSPGSLYERSPIFKVLRKITRKFVNRHNHLRFQKLVILPIHKMMKYRGSSKKRTPNMSFLGKFDHEFLYLTEEK